MQTQNMFRAQNLTGTFARERRLGTSQDLNCDMLSARVNRHVSSILTNILDIGHFYELSQLTSELGLLQAQ